MKNGLIIYQENDANKNQWFIDECLKYGNDNDFSLLYKEENDVLNYIKDHKIDFVIYRSRDYRLLSLLQDNNITCFNNSEVNRLANDKYQTYLMCLDKEIPCLETYLNSYSNLSYPFIQKSLNGHGGNQVYLIKTINDLRRTTNDYIYQRYIPNASDVRIYVLNQKIIGTIKRSNANDYRSNYSLGGKVEPYKITTKMQEIAYKITKDLKAFYLGIDFLVTDEAIYLNEIEDPVGARMLYQVLGVNTPKLLIEEIKKELKIAKTPQ